MGSAKIDADGNAALDFEHASAYTIVISDEPMSTESQEASADTTGTDTGVTPESPNTMEAEPQGMSPIFWILLGAAALVVIAGGVYFIIRKKENGEK